MGDWSLIGAFPFTYNMNGSETEYIKQVDPGSSDHNKGSWVELCSALPFDVSGLILNVNATYVSSEYLIDLGIGAGGSEIVLVPNLLFSLVSNSWWATSSQYNIPIGIKSGTRIAARQQARTSSPSNWLKMSLQIFPANSFLMESLQCCEAFGANTGDTGGVSIDPGGSANTEGSWVELSSALPRTIRAFQFAVGSAGDPNKTSAYWAVDIGLGPEGSEIEIIKDFNIAVWTAVPQYQPQVSPLFPISLPTGSRLAARCKCTITTETDRLLDIVAHGYS